MRWFLKNFHLDSHDRIIVPILVATEAKENTRALLFSVYDDMIYNPIMSNTDNLQNIIGKVIEREHAQPSRQSDIANWAISRYYQYLKSIGIEEI